jgi:hypothetical protein
MKPMRPEAPPPPSPVRSPLEAVHHLSEAVLSARTPADVTDPQVVAALTGRLRVPALSPSASAASAS